MNLEALRRHCATLPGATRDIKWGVDEVYSVGHKMFAVFNVERGKAQSASFKCDPERFLELTDVPGIALAPYLARAHWVQLEPAATLDDAGARGLIERSHALILGKLPMRTRNEILGTPARVRGR